MAGIFNIGASDLLGRVSMNVLKSYNSVGVCVCVVFIQAFFLVRSSKLLFDFYKTHFCYSPEHF